MSRRRTALAVIGFALSLCFAAPPDAPAAAPIARPDPVLVSVQLDYVSPLHGSDGKTAVLAPLQPAVSAQAVSDETYLHYRVSGDLGGFVLAPVGASAMSSGGKDIVGAGANVTQIPQYGEAAQGVVRSFAFVGAEGGAAGRSDNGRAPLPRLGVPPLLEAPTNSNAVPPPNQGFGGRPVPEGTGQQGPSKNQRSPEEGPAKNPSKEHAGGEKHPSHKQPPPAPPPTTTTPTTTTTPSTTTIPTTTPVPSEEEPHESGASCGTTGLRITSDHSTCRIYAVNMEPGQSASEVMTVRDEAGVPVTLSLRAGGEQNRFWHDLRMGVWQVGTPAPDPLPELLWWTTQDNVLTTLQSGQSVPYEVELYLPLSAGNEDQGQTAIIDLTWSARQ